MRVVSCSGRGACVVSCSGRIARAYLRTVREANGRGYFESQILTRTLYMVVLIGLTFCANTIVERFTVK